MLARTKSYTLKKIKSVYSKIKSYPHNDTQFRKILESNKKLHNLSNITFEHFRPDANWGKIQYFKQMN